MEQAMVESTKADDEHNNVYREMISELKKKVDFQRAELANLNKKKVKEDVSKYHMTIAEMKIARQRKELAKLNHMIANSSRNGKVKAGMNKANKTTGLPTGLLGLDLSMYE
jgi:uncharacterized coiled-coil protein SlyX